MQTSIVRRLILVAVASLNATETSDGGSDSEDKGDDLPSGGGLNARLRQRYKKLKAETAPGSGVDDAIVVDGDGDSSVAAGTDPALPQSAAAAAAAAGSQKGDVVGSKRKRKSEGSRSRPGGRYMLGGGARGGDGGGEGGYEDGGASVEPAERPRARYSDLGGMESALQEVRELIEFPMVHPEIFAELGVTAPRGVLLHGPPGCGKTLLANAIAGVCADLFHRLGYSRVV